MTRRALYAPAAKCRGSQVLDTLCTAELEPLLPAGLRSGRHLAPGRKRE